ncbi:MAG: hypothetical protein J7K31_00345 [Candidatus Aenigmarchaeota archaeon]|nr:hypothetical protein [Candidatus Aenigmarchaeota archaeon]
MKHKFSFLEVVFLKCPKCGNVIVEPSWLSDIDQDFQCADCGEFFSAKNNELDRKMLKFAIDEDERIENVSFEDSKKV